MGEFAVHRKPPVIEGRVPDSKLDLDNMKDLQSGSKDISYLLKIADEYDHYPDCKWAIVEYKSRSLKDAVEQLSETAEKLSKQAKPLSFAFIVSMKMNHAESRIFRKRGNVLYNKLTKSPVQIRFGGNRLDVQLYYVAQIEMQYQKYEESIIRWASK